MKLVSWKSQSWWCFVGLVSLTKIRCCSLLFVLLRLLLFLLASFRNGIEEVMMIVLGFEWREVWILKLSVCERNSVENVVIDNVLSYGFMNRTVWRKCIA